MKSANFKIIPLTTIPTTLHYGRIFRNALECEEIAQGYLKKSKIFIVTDHSGKGLKYVMSQRPDRIEQIKAFSNRAPSESDSKEICLCFKDYGIVKEDEQSWTDGEDNEVLNLTTLNDRNEAFATLMDNTPWIEEAKICFLPEETYFSFKCRNEEMTLGFKGAAFSTENISDDDKSFFIAHDLREQEIVNFQNGLKAIQNDFTRETNFFIFSYLRGQGLLSHE